jgi:hypothetical protein
MNKVCSSKLILTAVCSVAFAFSSHADTLEMPDQMDLVSATTLVASAHDITNLVGHVIDTSYEGELRFSFTINCDAVNDLASTYMGFHFYNDGFAQAKNGMYIGTSSKTTNWATQFEGAINVGKDYTLLNGAGETVAQVAADPQVFEMTIQYVAGGFDTNTIIFAGGTNVFVDNFSFTELYVDGTRNDLWPTDFYDMWLTADPIPPKSTVILIR